MRFPLVAVTIPLGTLVGLLLARKSGGGEPVGPDPNQADVDPALFSGRVTSPRHHRRVVRR